MTFQNWQGVRKESALMRERIVAITEVRASCEDPKLFWLSAGLVIAFQAVIGWMLLRVAPFGEILGHQLTLSLDRFLLTREEWGPNGTSLFLQHYWLDFLYPAVYALFLRCLLTQIHFSYPAKYVFHSLSLPLAAAIYDEIENACQMALMAGWTENKIIFYAGALSAYVKWILLLVSVGCALTALVQMRLERAR